MAKHWRGSGLSEGIYNQVAILHMNGRIDVGSYGHNGNVAEYRLNHRIRINTDVIDLNTDFDQEAADLFEKASKCDTVEERGFRTQQAQAKLVRRRKVLMALAQALVHEGAHAHSGFTLSAKNDEYEGYSAEAWWNGHLWRRLPDDRKFIEAMDSDTLSASKGQTSYPITSRIPK